MSNRLMGVASISTPSKLSDHYIFTSDSVLQCVALRCCVFMTHGCSFDSQITCRDEP